MAAWMDSPGWTRWTAARAAVVFANTAIPSKLRRRRLIWFSRRDPWASGFRERAQERLLLRNSLLRRSPGLVNVGSGKKMGQVFEAMDSRQRARGSARARATGAGLLLAAALALPVCGREPAPLAFPSEPSGRLEIRYPLD